MENKHCIRIENLADDQYSLIFVDEYEYSYCEYAYEVSLAITKIINNFQNKNEDFYIECVYVDEFSEGKEMITGE